MMEKFTYRTPEALLHAAKSVGYDLPFSEDLSVLGTPVTVDGSNVTLKNRLTVHPMEGFDSTLDGAPGELTIRRCDRFSTGGAGLIWLEATTVVEEGRTSEGQLWIHEGNADQYKALAERMHKMSDGTPLSLSEKDTKWPDLANTYHFDR